MPIKDIRQVKLNLRNHYKKVRANIPQKQKVKIDNQLTNKFLSLLQYKKCSTLFIYISKDIEVETKDIINSALKSGKMVAVPKCLPKSHLMDFYYINSYDDLEIGHYGLYEPKTGSCKKVTKYYNAVCVVPGLAFDSEGYRLGFGMGYYDRFLSDFKGTTIGICYANCIKWNLPHGYFDRPVDIVVTERYIRYVRTISNQKSEE